MPMIARDAFHGSWPVTTAVLKHLGGAICESAEPTQSGKHERQASSIEGSAAPQPLNDES